jgi:hypothetical protein
MRLYEFAPDNLLENWTVVHEERFPDGGTVRFLASDLFRQTFADKMRSIPGLEEKFQEFQSAKAQNPGAPFGGSDHPMISRGPLGKEIPKLRHAHLTRDLSVYYTVSGRDPVEVKLYGIFAHNESGTGTPANIKRQKNLARVMSRQSFG